MLNRKYWSIKKLFSKLENQSFKITLIVYISLENIVARATKCILYKIILL